MKNFYLISLLLISFSFSSNAQVVDCDMIEISIENWNENQDLIQVYSNIPEDPAVIYSWTLTSATGDVYLVDSTSNPIFELNTADTTELFLCLDISVNLIFDELFCTVCQALYWDTDQWVIVEGNEDGDNNGGDNGDEEDNGDEDNGDEEGGSDLIFEIECNNGWITVSPDDFGMSDEEFLDMINSDINNDGFVSSEDFDMLGFLLGCNDIEWENNTPIDSNSLDSNLFVVYTFMCNDELISVSPYELGFSPEEFDLLMYEYNVENSELESAENFLAMIFGCDETEWNDDLGNEEDVMYESFIFECNGVIISLDFEVLEMGMEDFSALLNIDLNQDEIIDEDDLAYLFGCDMDSLDVNWLSAINNSDLPDGFADYIFNMMNSGSDSFSYMDFLNSSEATSISNTSFSPKRLLKITNLLGEKVTFKPNEVLFYIFDDGSIEKRVFIK